MSSDINVQTFSGKVNITSNLLVGSSHLFVDTINNRVGLVTTTPDAGIHVNSNAYVHTDFRVGSGIVMNDTSGRITAGSFVGDGSGLDGINSDSGSWVNGANSNVHLATSTDNVGIGTTSPSQKLDVVGGPTKSDGFILGTSNNLYTPGCIYTDSNWGMLFRSAVSSPGIADFLFNDYAGNQMMVIDGGNVGIGVTDPDSKLEVRGNIRASFSDTNHGMFIDAGGTVRRDYGGNGAGFHFTSNAIWPTNYLGSYSAGGIDLGSSSYPWNNVYTEALNASGTITATTFSGALSGNATSATNADTVDGLHASSFLRSDADDTVNAGVTYTWTATDTHGIAFKNSSYNTFLYLGGWSSTSSDNISRIRTSTGNLHIDSGNNGNCYLNWYSAGTIELGRNTNVRGTVTATTFTGALSGNASTATSLQADSTANRLNVYSSTYAAGYNTAALEIREYNLESAAGGTEYSRAPRIGFHWGGRVASQLVLEASGAISCVNNPGNAYEQFKCAALNASGAIFTSSSIEADGRIYADNGCHVRADWLRVNGQAGIYFESYGGGWWMTDSTWIRSYGTKKLHVNNEINTNNRVYASGYVYTTMLARYYSRVSGNAETTANRPISVYAEHHMRCSELHVTSDRRIKTDIVDVDDGSALELLRKIQPKTYGYVDTMEKGTKRVYGFIAQEIKELIPEAVDVSEGDLPNIYGHATVDHEQNTITFRDFDTNNLNQTDSIIYIDQDDKRQTLKIKSVLNSTQLEIEEDLEKIVEAFQTSELEEYKFTGEIFIWGQHVDDFHHLQKSAIYTVATAALQEVDRQLQAEKVKTHQMEEDLQAEKIKTRELEQKLEILEMSHASLIQRIEALEKL